MSAYPPPPPDPLAYYTPAQPLSRRPTSVSVIAWFAIVFGALGAVGGFCLIIRPEFLTALEAQSPFGQVMQTPGIIANFYFISQIIGWFASVALLSTGIGCLRLKSWARRSMIFIMIYQLASLVVGITFGAIFVFPALNRIRQQNPNNVAFQMGYTSGVAGQISSVIFGFAYTFIVIYFITRLRVKEAFEPPAELPNDLQTP